LVGWIDGRGAARWHGNTGIPAGTMVDS